MLKLFNLFSKNYNISEKFGKINIIYGPNLSGKTTLSTNLEEIFLGKDKTAKFNDLPIEKATFSVIKIDSNFDINEFIKLTSKNIFKNKIKDILNNTDLADFREKQIELLEILQKELNSKLEDESSIIKRKIKNLEIDDLLLNLIEGSSESSKSEENLFYIKTKLDNSISNNIIIIDDFDAFLNEDSIIKLFNILEEIDGIAFLFTSNSQSLFYSLKDYSNFVLRDGHLYDLNTVINKHTDSNNINDYLINDLYSTLLTNLYKNQRLVNSLGRVLNNRNINITTSKEYKRGYVNIYCNNESEFEFLTHVKKFLDNN